MKLPADIRSGLGGRWAGARIFVAGHRGLVGRALCRRLAGHDGSVLTAERSELDLRRQADTEAWMEANRPDIVILAAATAGGIADNQRRPADYIRDNMAIALNVLTAAHVCGVSKLAYLGSSCIYPRASTCPIAEDALLSGPLEPTNEAYAIAKIAGLKLAQYMRRQYGADFISVMPANLYGPGDRFDDERGHVIPALIRKFDEARMSGRDACVVWGSGEALREFLHVDDCADGILFALSHYTAEAPLNLGSGEEVSIATLAGMIAEATGYQGRIAFDRSRPDGAPRKMLDSSVVRAMGWRPRVRLQDGLPDAVRWWRTAYRAKPAASLLASPQG